MASHTHNLKDVLIKQGLLIEDVETAIQISGFITKNLFQKCGVILPNQEVVNIGDLDYMVREYIVHSGKIII